MKYMHKFKAKDKNELEILAEKMPGKLTITLTVEQNGECCIEAEHEGFTVNKENYNGLFDEQDRLALEFALILAAKDVQTRFRKVREKLLNMVTEMIDEMEEEDEMEAEEALMSCPPNYCGTCSPADCKHNAGYSNEGGE